MKTKLMALVLLAAGSVFAAPRIAVGVEFGSVRSGYAYVPPCPGPGYEWIDGYYDYSGGARFWHAGYWRAPVIRERFVPRYEHRGFERGRFENRGFERGRFENHYRR